MSFEIAGPGGVVRTTGTLRYTTQAAFSPANHGWLLDEKFESDNGGKSCRGELSTKVREHLAQKAYIEILGDSLFYYGSVNSGRHIEFKRDGA